jgi:pilus assembly protein CpaE
VMGAKGGVGTTTVAINVGAALLQADANPIIADFRLGYGSMGLAMGVGRSQGMARMLAKPVADINPKAIEGDLAHHQSGLRMLVSSANPRETQVEYMPDSAKAVVDQLRTLANPTILDLGAGLNPRLATVLPELDRLIIVVEPNAVALQMARGLMAEIENLMGAGRMNVVVLNRAQSSLQTPWHEVENILGREVKAIISAAPELAFQSMENNVPMVILQPNAIVSTQFIKLADELKGSIR